VSLLVFARGGVTVVPLRTERSVVLGREPPSDVVLDDDSLSRKHAEFWVQDGEVRVRDLGSRNGTRVGTSPVGPNDEIRLRPGERAYLGKVAVVLHCLAELDRPTTLVPLETFEARLDEELHRCKASGRTLELCLLNGRAEAILEAIDQLSPYERATQLGPHDWLFLWPIVHPNDADARAESLAVRADGTAGVVTSWTTATSSELIDTCEVAIRSVAAGARLGRAVAGVGVPRPVGPLGQIIAKSERIQLALRTAARLGASNLALVITGPTGSGKEVVAAFIHRSSPRHDKPFLALNCATLTPGLVSSELFGHVQGAFTGADGGRAGIFEAVRGGTVLLDEIGELSLDIQAALLRVLELGRVRRVGSTEEVPADFRLLTATHTDLEAAVRAGRFREDLYYRLCGETIRVPSLAERPEDILPLARHFVLESGKKLSPSAEEALLAYRWPGNVRELRQAVQRALAMCTADVIELEDLPEKLRAASARVAPREGVDARPAGDLRAAVDEFERALIGRALADSGGKRAEAARALNVPERTLSYRMKVLGLLGRG
jgi:DNA-binding NtrC family response regulator